MNKHEILDVKVHGKDHWKHLVNHLIHLENRQILIDWSRKYKKVDTLALECEEYKLKDYFSQLNLADSRLKFRERSGCLNTCRVAFPSANENIKASFKCFHCPQLDTGPNHWVNCSTYREIIKSKKLNISVETDLLTYYREIIRMRTNEEF